MWKNFVLWLSDIPLRNQLHSHAMLYSLRIPKRSAPDPLPNPNDEAREYCDM